MIIWNLDTTVCYLFVNRSVFKCINVIIEACLKPLRQFRISYDRSQRIRGSEVTTYCVGRVRGRLHPSRDPGPPGHQRVTSHYPGSPGGQESKGVTAPLLSPHTPARRSLETFQIPDISKELQFGVHQSISSFFHPSLHIIGLIHLSVWFHILKHNLIAGALRSDSLYCV